MSASCAPAALASLRARRLPQVVAHLGARGRVAGALVADGDDGDAVAVERGGERREGLDEDDAEGRARQRRVEAERARPRVSMARA